MCCSFYWYLPITQSSPSGYPGMTTTFLHSTHSTCETARFFLYNPIKTATHSLTHFQSSAALHMYILSLHEPCSHWLQRSVLRILRKLLSSVAEYNITNSLHSFKVLFLFIVSQSIFPHTSSFSMCSICPFPVHYISGVFPSHNQTKT